MAAWLLAGVLLGCAGCVSMIAPKVEYPDFVRAVPVPTLVLPGQELAAAEQHALRDHACFALSGAGRSMEPIYASGTAIVVREQSYRILRAGQVIVYRNRRGAFVAHSLVRELPDGWIVTGLNNTQADGELVTSKNFVGVVTAAYTATRSPADAVVATRAIREGIDSGARTASLP